jgi:hypothetical protein
LGESGNVAKFLWPAGVGLFVYSTAAARAKRGIGPLVFGGLAAYAVVWAMRNQTDYIALRLSQGGSDYVPF